MHYLTHSWEPGRAPHFTDGNPEAWGGAVLCPRIDDGVMGGFWSPSSSCLPSLTPLLTSGRYHSPPSFTPMRDSSSSPPAESHPLHLKPSPSLPSLSGSVCMPAKVLSVRQPMAPRVHWTPASYAQPSRTKQSHRSSLHCPSGLASAWVVTSHRHLLLTGSSLLPLALFLSIASRLGDFLWE